MFTVGQLVWLGALTALFALAQVYFYRERRRNAAHFRELDREWDVIRAAAENIIHEEAGRRNRSNDN